MEFQRKRELVETKLKDNIQLDSNNFIQSIKFNNELTKNTPIDNMNDWTDIPKISIITGRNGSGKTELLHYIADSLRSNPNIKIIFQNDNVHLDQTKEIGNLIVKNHTTIIKLKESAKIYVENQKNFEDFHLYNFPKEELNQFKLDLDGLRMKRPYPEPLENIIAELINKLLCSVQPKPANNLLAIVNMFRKFNELRKSILNQKIREKYLRKFYFSTYTNPTDEDFKQNLNDPGKKLEKEFLNHELVRFKLEEKFFQHLEEIGFKLEITEDDSCLIYKRINGEFKLINYLSYGEVFILNVLALKYNLNETSKTYLILLDELDKSLDPDYIILYFELLFSLITSDTVNDDRSKIKVQIIMTTHRTDTIKLAANKIDFNKIGIFSIKNIRETNRFQIEKCSPMIAIFRLSFDRNINNVKTRVYVESFTDKEIYEFYYKYLRILCQKLRSLKQKRIEINSREEFKIMSERYQLDFVSCAIEKSAGGGCAQVIACVKRDLNNGSRFTSGISGIPLVIERSFGLIDSDLNYIQAESNVNKKRVDDIKLNERIAILKRHSIENLIFDPILLFCNQSNLKNYLVSLKDSDFRNSCLEILNLNNLKERLINKERVFDAFFRKILEQLLNSNEICAQIYNFLLKFKDGKFDRSIFSMYIIDEKNNRSKLSTVKLEELNKLICHLEKCEDNEKLDKEFITSYLVNLTEPIKYIYQLENNELKLIEYDYPCLLLYLRGHTIEDQIKKLFKIKKNDFNNEIMKQFKCFNKNNFYFIPLDLIQSYFVLNQWVVNQANDTLKT